MNSAESKPSTEPTALGIFNGDLRTVREALERYEEHGQLRVSNGWSYALNDIQRAYSDLIEQCGNLVAAIRANAEESDYCIACDCHPSHGHGEGCPIA